MPARRCDVRCVDNFYTGTKANVAHLHGDPHFEMRRHDITFPLYVETLFFDYYRQHALDIKVARLFNTCGPRTRLDDGRVVSGFVVQALPADDPAQRQRDISLARAALGWAPSVALDDSLRRAIDYFRPLVAGR